MKVHPDEFAMAREYSNSHDFEHLNPEQIHQVMVRGRELHKWLRAHPRLHAAISLSVIGSIFAIDWLVSIALARWFVASPGGTGLSSSRRSASALSTVGSFTRSAFTRCTRARRTT